MGARDTQSGSGDFVVRRRVSVVGLDAAADGRAIRERLSVLPGVQEVNVDAEEGRVQITYDTSHVGFAEIEAGLADAGHPRCAGIASRLRAWWYRYLDENARDNARSRAACCSNPRGVYAGRRKR